MRISVSALLIGVLIGSVAIMAVAKDSGEPTLSIMTVGNIDKTLKDRIVAYIEKQYGLAPKLVKSPEKPPATMAALKSFLAENIEGSDLCLLALASLPGCEKENMVDKEGRYCAVNMLALKPARALAGDGNEILARRVEKESLRAIALTMGARACVFPRCALYSHKDKAELDFKARNLCPPCQKKIGEILKSKGIALE